jgi:hypothetical protein
MNGRECCLRVDSAVPAALLAHFPFRGPQLTNARSSTGTLHCLRRMKQLENTWIRRGLHSRHSCFSRSLVLRENMFASRGAEFRRFSIPSIAITQGREFHSRSATNNNVELVEFSEKSKLIQNDLEKDHAADAAFRCLD